MINNLLSEYYNQANKYDFSNHADGHSDWMTGSDDDVSHADKHEDCNLL